MVCLASATNHGSPLETEGTAGLKGPTWPGGDMVSFWE